MRICSISYSGSISTLLFLSLVQVVNCVGHLPNVNFPRGAQHLEPENIQIHCGIPGIKLSWDTLARGLEVEPWVRANDGKILDIFQKHANNKVPENAFQIYYDSISKHFPTIPQRWRLSNDLIRLGGPKLDSLQSRPADANERLQYIDTFTDEDGMLVFRGEYQESIPAVLRCTSFLDGTSATDVVASVTDIKILVGMMVSKAVASSCTGGIVALINGNARSSESQAVNHQGATIGICALHAPPDLVNGKPSQRSTHRDSKNDIGGPLGLLHRHKKRATLRGRLGNLGRLDTSMPRKPIPKYPAHWPKQEEDERDAAYDVLYEWVEEVENIRKKNRGNLERRRKASPTSIKP